MTEIPKEISSLKKLNRLYAKNNEIESIHPKIGELKSLMFLEVSNNKVKELPATFKNLTKLWCLGLSGNQLTQIPPIIFTDLTGIIQLGFHSNRLCEIPDEIGKLTLLKKIDFSKNRLTKIPDTIVLLTKLEWINLAHNNIENLPVGLSDLVALQDFGIANNKLKSIAGLAGMQSLRSLAIYNNKISTIDGNVIATLPNLEILEARQNEIRILPWQLFALPRIKKIDLQRNNITNVQFNSRESEFATFCPLEILLLQHNMITTLPKDLQNLISRLEDFSLVGNPLIQCQIPPKRIRTSLKQKTLNIVVNRLPADFALRTEQAKALIPRGCNLMYENRRKCNGCGNYCVHEMVEFVTFYSLENLDGSTNLTIPFLNYLCNIEEGKYLLENEIIEV